LSDRFDSVACPCSSPPLRLTGDGSANKTIVNFRERSVRAIKIHQVGDSRDDSWWQIGEIVVGCRM
jgi:hypothetical protein